MSGSRTKDEKFLALDGKTYSLGEDNLVIADDARAVGIGGVMGGEDTGVTETTRNVLLESAYFRPASVRRTARDIESAERLELSLRARRRSRDDSARITTRHRTDPRTRRRESTHRDRYRRRASAAAARCFACATSDATD